MCLKENLKESMTADCGSRFSESMLVAFDGRLTDGWSNPKDNTTDGQTNVLRT